MSGPPVRVGVVGGGAWGIALASAAARAGSSVLVHTRREGGLPDGVARADSFAAIGRGADLVLVAVPSGVAREVARDLGDHLDGKHLVVHGVRGLTGESLRTVSDIVREETPARRVGAIGGPVLERELRAGSPSVLVVGSRYPEVCDAVAVALGGQSVRVYRTADLVGLEWGSALVACLAVAVGYAIETRTPPGLLAAFVSRGVDEAARLAAAAGGDERTLLGLAGYGDLLASTAQDERPEVRLGRAIARGERAADAARRLGERVEAIDLLPRLVAWADAERVRAPILAAIADGILGGRPRAELVRELMTGPIPEPR